MSDLIVSVPDHCLSFYFEARLSRLIAGAGKKYNIISYSIFRSPEYCDRYELYQSN